MRHAARTDANKTAVVEIFLKFGCSVYDLKMPVDLLVGRNGLTKLVEIKDGAKRKSEQKYTKAQVKFMADWRGDPVVRVTSVEEAIALAEAMRYACIRSERKDDERHS